MEKGKRGIKKFWLMVVFIALNGLFACSYNNSVEYESEIMREMPSEAAVPPIITRDEINRNINRESYEETNVTCFYNDLQYMDCEKARDYLLEQNIYKITVPIAWSEVEPQRDSWEFDRIDEKIKIFADAGFEFIFILDAGGRMIVDESGKEIQSSIPDWVWDEADGQKMLNFEGHTGIGRTCFDYASKHNVDLILEFYDETIAHLEKTIGDHITGFAPGIMWEFEIKWPQEGYAWTSYTDASEEAFVKYLINKYETLEDMNVFLKTSYNSWAEVRQPIVNYRNSITQVSLADEPLYPDFMLYREAVLEEFVSPLFDCIHEKGYVTVGYFGQVLHPHDGIYGAGIVQRLNDKVDIAVIDCNFYDGYSNIYDDILPAFMTNYMVNLGYKSVYTGIYVERLDMSEASDFIQQVLNYVEASGMSDGYELGGLRGSEIFPDFEYRNTKRNERAEIALYVSEWNYYKDHGEYPEYINYFTDAVAQMYKIIQYEIGMDVDIISDKHVLDGTIYEYDVVGLIGQFYVDETVKDEILAYTQAGGKLFSDFRFGEWDIYGNNTEDWLDSAFGIIGREALAGESKLIENAEWMKVGQGRVYAFGENIPSRFAIMGDESTSYLFRDDKERMYGLANDRTLVLCWQPQLLYKYAFNEEEKQYAVKVIKAALEYLIE